MTRAEALADLEVRAEQHEQNQVEDALRRLQEPHYLDAYAADIGIIRLIGETDDEFRVRMTEIRQRWRSAL